MFDTVSGLPVHVLVLHAAVIGVPVAALATVAVAVRPQWLPRLGWWVVGLNALILAVVYVTKESGQEFVERRYPDPANRSPDLRTHVSRGEDMIWYAVALFAVSLILVLVARRVAQSASTPKPLPPVVVPVVGVLAVAAAVLATVQVVLVGHAGSEAVWKGSVDARAAVSAPR
ncbi:DUF2231 domain-containing protein [Yinghuangia sp. YIM S09857]|uniref:DUF2231 domain-containing protein n=1 Tax=Yinghuangia sp. YIM S09857 TaxID=3436929 RepID=UPI003F53017A